MTTISLELAKKLYDKGLRLETEKWGYLVHRVDRIIEICADENFDPYSNEEVDVLRTDRMYPALSTDELLAVMPDMFSIIKLPKDYGVKDMDGKYAVLKKGGRAEVWDYNPSEALGLMCEWLLDNGWKFNGKELVR